MKKKTEHPLTPVRNQVEVIRSLQAEQVKVIGKAQKRLDKEKEKLRALCNRISGLHRERALQISKQYL